MKLIVDRIEENKVVCENENGGMVEIEFKKFVTMPKDGDMVCENDEGMYIILEEETKKEKEEISERFMNLFKK